MKSTGFLIRAVRAFWIPRAVPMWAVVEQVKVLTCEEQRHISGHPSRPDRHKQTARIPDTDLEVSSIVEVKRQYRFVQLYNIWFTAYHACYATTHYVH
ncbi:hypothetical protein J6590_063719 [Homalodisca vitripennis]|nr:hypothetical protein J6590_063719 [Homalodisca vitripennis]